MEMEEVNQVQAVRTQQDSQEEEWSIPSNVGRRENDRERCETPRAPLAPSPSEDRLFTDWSSIDSPRERMSPPDASVRNIVPNISQPDTQTVQPGSEPARIEVMGNTLNDVMTFPSTCQQLNQVGTGLIDRETNMSDIEVRSQREEIRVNNSSNDGLIVPSNRDVQMPVSHSNISSYNTEMTQGSHTRTHNTEMMPQLDGPMSVHSRRRMLENEASEQESFWRTAVTHRREYLDENSNNSHSGQRTHDNRRPPERRYPEGSGRPPDGGNNHERGYSRRGRPPDRSGGPPDDGGPPGNRRYPRHPGGQEPPSPPGPPGPVRPIIVQQPPVTLDTTTLENTFSTVGQSMLQLARAQDQTNRHLQQHLQQGQLNMQAHTGALQQLATSCINAILTTSLLVSQYMMEATEKVSFHG